VRLITKFKFKFENQENEIENRKDKMKRKMIQLGQNRGIRPTRLSRARADPTFVQTRALTPDTRGPHVSPVPQFSSPPRVLPLGPLGGLYLFEPASLALADLRDHDVRSSVFHGWMVGDREFCWRGCAHLPTIPADHSGVDLPSCVHRMGCWDPPARLSHQ
jgi:hypothetical protein